MESKCTRKCFDEIRFRILCNYEGMKHGWAHQTESIPRRKISSKSNFSECRKSSLSVRCSFLYSEPHCILTSATSGKVGGISKSGWCTIISDSSNISWMSCRFWSWRRKHKRSLKYLQNVMTLITYHHSNPSSPYTIGMGKRHMWNKPINASWTIICQCLRNITEQIPERRDKK